MTLFDLPIDHPTSGEDYGPGAIVGLRTTLEVSPAASLLALPILVLLVIPVGLTVPTVNTVATMKQNEKYVWATHKFEVAFEFGTTFKTRMDLKLSTVRRFDPGDRLVYVLVNIGGVAFGAAAEESYLLDMYLRED